MAIVTKTVEVKVCDICGAREDLAEDVVSKLAKYKGGDDIYYDDILEVVQKWIYSEEE